MTVPARTAPDAWEGVTLELRFADLFPCKPEWRIDPYLVQHAGLFYIWKGQGWLEHEGERLEAQPGDLFFTRPGLHVSAGHDPQRPVTVLSTGFILRARGGLDPLRQLALPRRLRLPPAERKAFAALFVELTGEFQHADPTAQLAARGLALRLLAEALRLTERLPATARAGELRARPGEGARVSAVLEYIDAHLDQPLQLRQLAKAAHLSPVYFAGLFRRETGLPPMEFIRRRRMERARSLLAAGDASIETVAAAVGFADPFHFSRAFRRATGMPPSAYRAALKNPFLK